jgi:predicted permease
MHPLRVLVARVKALWRRDAIADEIREEMRFHLEQRAQDFLQDGMTSEQARREALRQFGNLSLQVERGYDVRGAGMIEPVGQDIRYAFRALARRPGFTAAMLLTLALGIGANTAVFSVVSGVLLRPLPYPEPDRVAVLWLRSPGINIPQDWPSPGQYIDLQHENHSFQEMSISISDTGALLGRDQPERVEVLRTSSSLFHLLGARPLYGRLLLPEEDRPGRAPVIILSHAFWKRVLASDPAVVGRRLTMAGLGPDARTLEVVGVLRPDFLMNPEIMPTVSSITEMDAFLPLPFGADAVQRRGAEDYNLMARLKPGVTMRQAQADVSAIAGRIRDKDKRDRSFTISVVPLIDQVVGDVRRPVLVLLGSVALVLLIVCANVANLLLTRAVGRQQEIAIRTALGADWKQVVRQLLLETTLLALLGGALGLAIAQGALEITRALNPGNIPRLDEIGLDWRVLLFTFALSLLTGLLFGLAPALRATRVDMNAALKSGGRGVQGESGLGLSRISARGLLVACEVALSVMLLIGAGLLIQSFVRLHGVAPGFRADRVISLRLGVTGLQFPDRAATVQHYQDIIQRIAAVPGVVSAGFISALPFTSSVGWGGMHVEGYQPGPAEELQVDRRNASPDYFRTMGIPLIAGRCFTDQDVTSTPNQAAIVDAKFAHRFWPTEDPIGKHIWNDPDHKLTIVGVVGTVKQYGLDVDGRLVAYLPGYGGYVVARTTGDVGATTSGILRTIHTLDQTRAIYEVRTMDERIGDSLARPRFSALMLAALAGFAMLLAAIGVYGVMSYQVTQSTRDIGVRIALGADRSRIIVLIVRQGMTLAAIGIVAGVLGASAVTRLIASMLFGISAFDAMTFAIVSAVLGVVALLAVYVPASRAARIDPVVAFRCE